MIPMTEKELLICTNEFCLQDGREDREREFVSELADMTGVEASRFKGPKEIHIGRHAVSTRESCGRCLAACELRPAAVARYQDGNRSARHDVQLGETTTEETLQDVATFFDEQDAPAHR